MPELNNWYVLIFAVTGALIKYLEARKNSVPLVPAARAVASAFAQYAVLNMLWVLALNSLGLHWASLAGFGVGLLIGMGGLIVLLAFQSWRHRQRHWR